MWHWIFYPFDLILPFISNQTFDDKDIFIIFISITAADEIDFHSTFLVG